MDPADRLESWKEIGAYLKRDVRTVQRWEAFESLPVHRHQHKKRGSVYALKGEIDAWRDSRAAEFFIEPERPAAPAAARAPRWQWAFSAAALGAFVIAVVLSARTGPPPKPAAGTAWDPPRLLGELMRDGGTLTRIPLAAAGGSLAITPDGRTLFVTVCWDNGTSGLQAIDTATRSIRWTVERFRGCASPLLMRPDGKTVIIGDNSDVVVVDAMTKALRRIATHAARLRDFAWGPDARTLYAAAEFRGLLEIDLASGLVITRSPLPCPVALAAAPRGDRLYVNYQCSGPGGRPGHDAIETFETETGASLGSIVGPPNVGGNLAVSPDGSQLWADGTDACRSPHYDHVGCPRGAGMIVNVIRTEDRALIRSLRVGSPEEYGTRVSFSPDGSRAVVGNQELHVVSTASLTAVEGLRQPLWSNVVFAPDGSTAYLVTGDKKAVTVVPIVHHPAPPAGLTARWAADGVPTDSAGGNDIPVGKEGAFGPGRIGQAFRAGEGPPLRFTNPSNLDIDGDGLTAMAWVNIDEPGTFLEFAAKTATAPVGWQVFARADGRAAVCVGSFESGRCAGPGSTTIVSDAPLTPGWHHVAFTRSRAVGVLYVDGRAIGSSSGVNWATPVTEPLWLRIGSDEAGAAALRGRIDEIEIYNRALSLQEIRERGK